ncbi:cellulose biosynthesis protein BcsC [Novosphingobium sp. 9U]|uniref:cellulose biosynthesis protein BcsC n=1 Tax=Novosphingobium sp. 9U TaxID=2653158 RepID=UPI0012F384E7|nr:cellulose biosynthesis protein BcsC [Novosphingobium sp. 9U]VWX53628.1 Cellulose synthase operon protein C [Novosphingobium sp. 9U]
MARHSSLRLAIAALLVSTAGAGPVLAASPAVDALVKQAQYWRSKGREDLAEQAMRRARALDPGAKAAAAAAPAKAQPAPKPQAAAKPRATPAAKPAPAPARVEAKPAAKPPVKTAAAKPAPTPTPPASVRAGQARVAGYGALNSGSLVAAAAQFNKALAANRRDPEALGGLGLVRLRQQRFAEAADLLQQASGLGKASQWASGLAAARFFAGIGQARELLAQGRLDDAQAQAEQLVRSGYPEPAPALELLGDIYDKQGRYADSADFYRQALQGGAQDDARLQSRAARGRALAAAERGDDFNAEREFQNGLLLDRNDPWIRYEFARYLVKRGRMSDAEGLLRALASTGSSDTTYAAALLNNDLGRTAEADRLMGMIPDTQRTAPMRSFAIGVKVDAAIARTKQLAAAGQQGQAVNVLRQLGQMEAVPSAKLPAIADALIDMGDQGAAVSLAQTAIDSGRLDMDGYAGVIGVLTRTGREDLAQMALQRASQVVGNGPEGQRAYARMGATLSVAQADRARLAGQYATAFDMLQSAYNAAPDNPQILSALGRLYQAGGMAARAAQTYQLVLGRNPRDKDALLGLAASAQAAGDNALSERAQNDVLKLYPQDYQVRLSLAQVERARGDERGAVRLLKDARSLYSGAGLAAGGNPFAGMGGAPAGAAGANPFRNQAAPMAPTPINPFALGGGSRLPQQPNPQSSYPQPSYQPQSYAGGAAIAPGQNAPGQFTPASYAPDGGQIMPAAYPADTYVAQSYQAPAYSAPVQNYPTQIYPAQNYPVQGYPQQSYPQQAYPAPSYPQPQYPQQAYPQQGYPAPQGYPAQAYDTQAGSGVPASGYPADPVLAQIQSDISQLSEGAGPRADVSTSFRARSGEKGLSKLSEIKGNAKLSTNVLSGRAYISGEAVVIDAGRPTGSGLARFGRNGTPEAQAIVDELPSPLVEAATQHESGLAPAIGYESNAVKAEVGTTPIGMGKTKLTGRAEVSPKLGESSRIRAWVERKPVTDSVVSYAGTRDPVTGERWGQVMRTGGGAGFSYDSNGNGFYAEGRYNRYRGENVRKNDGIEANVGGYLRLLQTAQSRLTAGLNVNYQKYDNSQNYFTYGHGGYFSPQDFLSVSFPISYAMNTQSLELKASVTPGYQSYSQDEVPLYPTDAAAQAELDRLKVLNRDVRATYDSISKTGFAVAADASLYYRVGPNTRVGGEASYNTFGSYDEFRSTLGVRQTFGTTP